MTSNAQSIISGFSTNFFLSILHTCSFNVLCHSFYRYNRILTNYTINIQQKVLIKCIPYLSIENLHGYMIQFKYRQIHLILLSICGKATKLIGMLAIYFARTRGVQKHTHCTATKYIAMPRCPHDKMLFSCSDYAWNYAKADKNKPENNNINKASKATHHFDEIRTLFKQVLRTHIFVELDLLVGFCTWCVCVYGMNPKHVNIWLL